MVWMARLSCFKKCLEVDLDQQVSHFYFKNISKNHGRLFLAVMFSTTICVPKFYSGVIQEEIVGKFAKKD